MYVNQLETVPAINPRLQFPGGDIGDDAYERASEYVVDIKDDAPDKANFRYDRVQRMEIMSWRSLPGHEPVFRLLGKLAREWGRKLLPGDENAESIAVHGITQTIALNHMTNMLPLNLSGMENAVDDLGRLGAEQVRRFSQTNWASMAGSHRNVYAVMWRWYEHLADLLPAVQTDDQEELLFATVGVPYALAASKRMHGYLLSNPDRGAELLIKRDQEDSN